ncbi:hypothetical protein [Blastococcus sp. CT_GayMR20]|uniref:hypothetical protein n=1 Tax=Blastococcus sp. CT_GayMR20 TaxID=2559609 RepID=UPI0010730D3A|nr:hypothetical protein [Blastococcus sp. CT_GayMR20]
MTQRSLAGAWPQRYPTTLVAGAPVPANAEIGDRSYEPTDPAARSLLTTEAEGQGALIAVLERRREEPVQRLREPW